MTGVTSAIGQYKSPLGNRFLFAIMAFGHTR